MKNLLTVCRREFAAYFNSAIAAIFLIVFVIFTNGLFMAQFFQIGKADMRLFFATLPFTLTIFIPAIAMRLWTEDKRGNTFELLMTFPMKPYQLVLGKFLASLIFYLFALATTLTLPIMLYAVGRPDQGHIIGGYLGAALIGALFLAVGIFISGLCKDQIVAFILTVIATFALFFFRYGFFRRDRRWLGRRTGHTDQKPRGRGFASVQLCQRRDRPQRCSVFSFWHSHFPFPERSFA